MKMDYLFFIKQNISLAQDKSPKFEIMYINNENRNVLVHY